MIWREEWSRLSNSVLNLLASIFVTAAIEARSILESVRRYPQDSVDGHLGR